MEKIRGKNLKEWKEYCKSDNVPIKTMKYITCLEERIKQLTLTDVVKPFYCGSDYNHNAGRCKSQCRMCNLEEKKGQQ